MSYYEDYDLSTRDRYYFETHQYRYTEIPVGEDIYEMVETYHQSHQDAPQSSQEEDVRKHIGKFRKLCERLTKNQQAILKLHLKGYTQQEIADALNKSQGEISKALFGNYDYRRKRKYGGIYQKLKDLNNPPKCSACGAEVKKQHQRCPKCKATL